MGKRYVKSQLKARKEVSAMASRSPYRCQRCDPFWYFQTLEDFRRHMRVRHGIRKILNSEMWPYENYPGAHSKMLAELEKQKAIEQPVPMPNEAAGPSMANAQPSGGNRSMPTAFEVMERQAEALVRSEMQRQMPLWQDDIIRTIRQVVDERAPVIVNRTLANTPGYIHANTLSAAIESAIQQREQDEIVRNMRIVVDGNTRIVQKGAEQPYKKRRGMESGTGTEPVSQTPLVSSGGQEDDVVDDRGDAASGNVEQPIPGPAKAKTHETAPKEDQTNSDEELLLVITPEKKSDEEKVSMKGLLNEYLNSLQRGVKIQS